MIKQQPPPETDWETLSWNSGRSTPKTNIHNCLVGKSGSASHSFVLSDTQLQSPHKGPRSVVNGFSKSYSTHDNESRLSYSHVSKVCGFLFYFNYDGKIFLSVEINEASMLGNSYCLKSFISFINMLKMKLCKHSITIVLSN